MTTLTKPCVHYDSLADAVTVWFQRGVESARTDIIDNLRLADYDASGRLAFVELIGVSRGVRLDGLPSRDVIERELRPLAEREGWTFS